MSVKETAEGIELKACPFCGGRAEIFREYGKVTGIRFERAACTDCGAGTRLFAYGKPNHEAIAEMWNRRVKA